jgi:hypothetical protein
VFRDLLSSLFMCITSHKSVSVPQRRALKDTHYFRIADQD